MESQTELKTETNIVLDIIKNHKNFGHYPGNLQHYMKVIWNSAKLTHPCQNLSHMFYLLYYCYQATFYHHNLVSRDVRNMFIAAMFYDYNYGNDVEEGDAEKVERAIAGLEQHMQEEDMSYKAEIIECMRATQFPHIGDNYSVPALILRDVDSSALLNLPVINNLVIDVSSELEMTRGGMLRTQLGFISEITFETDWAETLYRPKINQRIEEIEKLIDMLYID